MMKRIWKVKVTKYLEEEMNKEVEEDYKWDKRM